MFLTRLNWSPERLAREINQLHGTEVVSLKAPYHWLRGSYPRGDMPEIVAGILSSHLTEDIDADQIWLSDHGPSRPVAAPRSYERDPDRPALTPVPTAVDAGARMAAVLDWLAGAGGDAAAPGRHGRPILPDLLRVVELRASQVLDLYEKYGGAAALDIAAGDLASAHGLARSASCDPHQAQRLYRTIARLSEIAGLSAAQAGDPAAAHRYLLTGLWAAQVTGDRALGAQLIAAMCETLRGSDREALRLISVALHGAQGSDDRVRRRLRCRQALAHAQLGDVTSFAAIAEGVAADALADRDDPGDAGLQLAELGLGWLTLDRPKDAARGLEAGLALLGDRHPYKRLHFSSALALALLRVGQGESAGRVVTGLRGLAVHLQADLDGLLPMELREAVGT